MPVSIRIEGVLGDDWATEEDFAGMSDEEVIELMNEDITAFLEEVKITVMR